MTLRSDISETLALCKFDGQAFYALLKVCFRTEDMNLESILGWHSEQAYAKSW